MISLEDIRIYLPKYLSDDSKQDLFSELSQFPENIDNRFYTSNLLEPHKILQGDCISDMVVINLPDTKTGNVKSIIVSNSCDIDLENLRLFSSSICYCAVYNLLKYEKRLREIANDGENDKIDNLIDNIKKQRVSQIFYLPIGGNLEYEGLIFFDKMCSCDNKSVSREYLNERRLFSLSNYGYYLFLFKLSIHFTRIREALDRK